jgi:hypothetical protein
VEEADDVSRANGRDLPEELGADKEIDDGLDAGTSAEEDGDVLHAGDALTKLGTSLSGAAVVLELGLTGLGVVVYAVEAVAAGGEAAEAAEEGDMALGGG